MMKSIRSVFGKAFDNRAGCACIVDTMKMLYEDRDRLPVNVLGAFAAQEEVGVMRGATVTSQVVKPDMAIVFRGFSVRRFLHQCRSGTGGV